VANLPNVISVNLVSGFADYRLEVPGLGPRGKKKRPFWAPRGKKKKIFNEKKAFKSHAKPPYVYKKKKEKNKK